MSVSDSPVSRDMLPPLDARAAEAVARKTSAGGSFWLQDEVASRMAQRLPLIKQAPERWLDWQPMSGGLSAGALVQAAYPESGCSVYQPHLADLRWAEQAKKLPWWRRWRQRPVTYTSETAARADMVWCNMLLHQHANPLALMKSWSQSLHPQGFVMFSCLGPDSLQELRGLYADLQWPPPHHVFTDMHDWGDMLLQAGFGQPVMDMERITLTYATAEELLKDLRAWGRNLHPGRFAALRGRGWRDQLCAAMQRQLVSTSHAGRLVLSFEIIYGHAFKSSVSSAVKPETRVPLQDMKQMLQEKKTKPIRP
jgi:malonyl-CoA O-methyltransferase